MNKIRRALNAIPLWEWLHHFYIVIALIIFVLNAIGLSHTNKEIIFIIAIIVYLFTLSLLTGFFMFTHGYKSRYAEATYMIHDAIHHVRDCFRYLDWCLDDNSHISYSKNELTNKTSLILTAISESFTLVTGVKCCASIKAIGKVGEVSNTPNDWYISTLARDHMSARECSEDDLKEGKNHIISENSEYMTLFKHDSKPFICNDLSKRRGYRNSKLSPDWEENGKWSLKYIARLVVPIRYVYYPTDKPDNGSEHGDPLLRDLYGYLVIDTATRGIFDGRYCPELACTYADSLFPMLETYRKVLSKEKDNES